jgi:3-methyl-2-oxobutanoate hydroxymethyltransferase
MSRNPVTVPALQQMKDAGEPITMLTCYDATFSRLLGETDIDLLLVGDSLGMVIQGHDTTLPVTLEEAIYHTRAVARGSRNTHIVGDLPFLTYQASPEQAVISAGRMLKEGGASSVKLEGGVEIVDAVRRCNQAGIPIMGHIGLTPQSIHKMGGFKVQGLEAEQAEKIFEDAMALEEAGAFCIVLEGIPEGLGKRITEALSIPTIGIGAGRHTNGQVLVIYDLLGLDMSFKPRFVRRYAEMGKLVITAAQDYCNDVRAQVFPNGDEVFRKTG